jgi:hypothetical protein
MNEATLFLKILRVFQREGMLSHLILVGSWCHFLYKIYFDNSPEIPLIRTLDLDFLIPNSRTIKQEVDIPNVLKELGFEPVRQYPSGLVKYGRPDLEIEFLVQERGRGKDAPVRIKKLGINAQALRFLSILEEHTMVVNYRGIGIRVPEPTAYVLHKFIIARRRTKREKEERDLAAAKELGEFLLKDTLQQEKLQKIFLAFPARWQRKVIASVKPASRILYDFLLTPLENNAHIN